MNGPRDSGHPAGQVLALCLPLGRCQLEALRIFISGPGLEVSPIVTWTYKGQAQIVQTELDLEGTLLGGSPNPSLASITCTSWSDASREGDTGPRKPSTLLQIHMASHLQG